MMESDLFKLLAKIKNRYLFLSKFLHLLFTLTGELLFTLATQETSLLPRKKLMLSLSKLCYHAASPSPSSEQSLVAIDTALEIVAQQESIPDEVLSQFGYTADTVKVFTIPEIIRVS